MAKQILTHIEPTIVLEPGSYIAGDAGFLLLRVDHLKDIGGRKWVTVDGGTNLLPTPVDRGELKIANRINSPPKEFVNVFGPIPSPHDLISTGAYLPEVHNGDILVVLGSGAYTLSYSNQFLYSRPNVIMLSREKGIMKIREKETFEDVLRMDRA